MGIIKAAAGSLNGVLADQWLEMYYCGGMPTNVLAQRGRKQITENSANTKGSDFVISDGSAIVVNEGQCALVIEQGRIIAKYDRPGENTFHSELTSSVFSKGGVKGILKQTAQRIGYGGDINIQQFVMYLDMKEHMGNRFSFVCPVGMKDRHENLFIDSTVSISGAFSFIITDPVTFYKNICRSSTGTVYLSDVLPQLEEELKSAAIAALSKVCSKDVSPTDISKSNEDICAAVGECMTEKWVSLRGFKVSSVAIDSIDVTDSDLHMIQQAERAKMLTDPNMAAATLIGAQADAMTAAAANRSRSGGTIFGLTAHDKSENIFLMKDGAKPSLWYCKCGSFNTTGFCENCGTKRPE